MILVTKWHFLHIKCLKYYICLSIRTLGSSGRTITVSHIDFCELLATKIAFNELDQRYSTFILHCTTSYFTTYWKFHQKWLSIVIISYIRIWKSEPMQQILIRGSRMMGGLFGVSEKYKLDLWPPSQASYHLPCWSPCQAVKLWGFWTYYKLCDTSATSTCTELNSQ